MHKSKVFYPFIVVLLCIAVFLFFASMQGWISTIPFINALFAPVQRSMYSTTHTSNENQLVQENRELTKKLVDYKTITQENSALRDQFQTTNIPSKQLVPAHIVGEPGFVTDQIDHIILDKGSRDGIKVGMVVVYKDNALGKIVKVTEGFSQMDVISNTSVSLSAKTIKTSAMGVVKGQGNGTILLDNVVLSQTLQKNDVVVSSGDQDLQGRGYPPNLIIGKITGVQKDPSALFQKANITSLVDITKLIMVFVITK